MLKSDSEPTKHHAKPALTTYLLKIHCATHTPPQPRRLIQIRRRRHHRHPPPDNLPQHIPNQPRILIIKLEVGSSATSNADD
jgi:hypothetical protein